MQESARCQATQICRAGICHGRRDPIRYQYDGEDVTVDDAIDYIADNIENLCDIIESNVGITDELCAAISLPEDQDGIKAPDFLVDVMISRG